MCPSRIVENLAMVDHIQSGSKHSLDKDINDFNTNKRRKKIESSNLPLLASKVESNTSVTKTTENPLPLFLYYESLPYTASVSICSSSVEDLASTSASSDKSSQQQIIDREVICSSVNTNGESFTKKQNVDAESLSNSTSTTSIASDIDNPISFGRNYIKPPNTLHLHFKACFSKDNYLLHCINYEDYT